MALPKAVAQPDWDFLGVILVIVVALCVLGFAAGWGLARLLRTDGPRRTSLMFGLGMNNNGTGLVLAAMALTQITRRDIAGDLLQPRSARGGRGRWPPGAARCRE